MKKKITAVLGGIAVLVFVLAGALLNSSEVQAAEFTYSGQVTDQTTADILYLSTSGGTVQIKIDSSTELDNAKFLLPGSSITANCTSQSDGYWHATKLTGNGKTSSKVTIDTSSKSTLQGTIAKGTSTELLYLVVTGGTMQVKMDDDTDVEGVRYLAVGKNVVVTCARGSDAYMHALSIADPGSSSSSSTSPYSSTSSSYSNPSASSGTVSGTVEKGTTAAILYLSTSSGTMQFVLDLATDASSCRALIPGQKVSVTFYRGSDAWNHSSKLVNNSSAASQEVTLSGDKATVSGTVSSETNESVLYLNTSGGQMQIRLDASTNFSRCPVLLVDKEVQVVCQRGSDQYYHALQINLK